MIKNNFQHGDRLHKIIIQLQIWLESYGTLRTVPLRSHKRTEKKHWKFKENPIKTAKILKKRKKWKSNDETCCHWIDNKSYQILIDAISIYEEIFIDTISVEEKIKAFWIQQ